MLVLLYVALSMAAKDGLTTFLVIAEAKGRARLAGALDALSDLANVLCTLYGAGEIIIHGWGLRGVEILAVMMATSLVGTTLWTQLGRRMATAAGTEPAAALEARIAALEAAVAKEN